ncbi:MAG: hypothetical protein KDB88_11865 [Flavobacteriales bacterium]|nr:hypothetical protein [Flavobacteriales bacterium]
MDRIVTLAAAVSIALGASAQKMKMTSGDFSALKGQSKVDIQFTYENMKVGKKSEADYLKEKRADYEKDEAGKGDKFVQSWNDDRELRFEPKFLQLFNDEGKGPIEGGKGLEDATYAFVIQTNMTEPGYNIGISKMPASINATVTLIERNGGKELGKMEVTGVPGSQFGGYDFDTGSRLAESYAKLGKELRQYLEKKVMK